MTCVLQHFLGWGDSIVRFHPFLQLETATRYADKDDVQQAMTAGVGTWRWMAPEVRSVLGAAFLSLTGGKLGWKPGLRFQRCFYVFLLDHSKDLWVVFQTEDPGCPQK